MTPNICVFFQLYRFILRQSHSPPTYKNQIIFAQLRCSYFLLNLNLKMFLSCSKTCLKITLLMIISTSEGHN